MNINRLFGGGVVGSHRPLNRVMPQVVATFLFRASSGILFVCQDSVRSIASHHRGAGSRGANIVFRQDSAKAEMGQCVRWDRGIKWHTFMHPFVAGVKCVVNPGVVRRLTLVARFFGGRELIKYLWYRRPRMARQDRTRQPARELSIHPSILSQFEFSAVPR